MAKITLELSDEPDIFEGHHIARAVEAETDMQSSENQKQTAGWVTPFFTIWIGQAFSLLGSQLVQFALVWWLTQTTGSATVLATASLAGYLPQVLLGPLMGTLVDRGNRRRIMIAADSMIALATLGLYVLFATGLEQIWHIYLLMFVRSLGSGFHWTAMLASTTLMVPEVHFARIQGLNESLNGAMNIIAAPLGALLLAWMPVQEVLLIDIGTALLAILPLLFIKIPQPAPLLSEAGAAPASVWQDFKAGFRYLLDWPGLRMLAGLAMLINLLLTPAFTLLPLLVTDHFGGDAFHLAWLESVSGVGVVVGGLLLGIWGGFKRRILTSLLGLLGVAAGSFVLGVTPAMLFPLAVGASFLLGASLPITNGPIHAILQSVVEPKMQGRVFTLLGSLASGMAPLGLVIAGPVSEWLGVRTWFVLGGVGTLIMAVVGLMLPAIMNIETQNRTGKQSVILDSPALVEPD